MLTRIASIYPIRGQRTRAERVRPEIIPPGISASLLGCSVYLPLGSGGRLGHVTDQKSIVLRGVLFCALGKGSRGEWRLHTKSQRPCRYGVSRQPLHCRQLKYHDDPNRLPPIEFHQFCTITVVGVLAKPENAWLTCRAFMRCLPTYCTCTQYMSPFSGCCVCVCKQESVLAKGQRTHNEV